MLLMFLLSFSNVFAQNPDGDDYKVKIEKVFQLLDKSPDRIKTGILFESGYNLVEQSKLNGNAGAPIDLTTWKTIYYSLQTAQVNNNSQLPPMQNVEGKFGNYPREQIQIPIMRVSYNNVLRYAFDKNWLKIDNEQLLDTDEGLQNDPYETNTAFAMAPIYDESKKGNVTFAFNQLQYLTNTGVAIKVIYADFGDGAGFKPYQLGDKPTIIYPNSGIKNLKFVVKFIDGVSLTSNSDFKVTVLEGSNARYAFPLPNITQSISVGTITGTLQIRYADNNQPNPNNPTPQIKKPLIVLGGYDPLNKYNYRSFIEDIGPYSTFNDNLAGIGNYDLVFLDYGNGGASIIDNAKLLQATLASVNSQKAAAGSTQKNTILGISMGGLVARYALSEMTKGASAGYTGYTDHQTSFLLTHDSPHQGANTAAGVQFLGRKIIGDSHLRTYIRPFSPILDDLAKFANSPAAREMLAYSTITTGVNDVTFVMNTFYAQYYVPMITFPSSITPTYKFLATSQGDECGAGIVGAGASLFSSTGGSNTNIAWGTFSGNLGYEFYMNAANGTNRVLYFRLWTRVTLWSWVFGGITIYENSRVFDIPNPVPALRLDSQPGGITPIGISFNFNVGRDFGIFGFTASGNATSAPGFCFVPRSSALDTYTPNYVGSLSGAYVSVPGYNNPSRANGFITQERISIAGITLPGNIVHTTFNYRQTQWLFDEIQANTVAISQNCAQNCKYPVDAVGAQINANNTVIAGSTIYSSSTTLPNTNIYSVSSSVGLSDPAISYEWSIYGLGSGSSASGVTFSGQGTPTVTLVGLPPNTGNFPYRFGLVVIISTKCWSNASTMNICSGGPKIVTPYTSPSINALTICIASGGGPVLAFRGATHVVVDGSRVIPVPSLNNVTVVPGLCTLNWNGTLQFLAYGTHSAYAYNTCASTPTYNFQLTSLGPNCRVVTPTPKGSTLRSSAFTLSPNPSSGNEITISQDISETSSETSASTGEEKEQAQAQSEAKNEEFTLILYNKLQVKVRETTLNTLSKTISTEGLPNDVYFLHIISKDGNRVVKQVMILR